jgi:hypothetical protein
MSGGQEIKGKKMRNIISDGTYLYTTFRVSGAYYLQRRNILNGDDVPWAPIINIDDYFGGNKIGSMCLDDSYIYLSGQEDSSGRVAQFNISDGQNNWIKSIDDNYFFYKVKTYGTNVYLCGWNEALFKASIVVVDKAAWELDVFLDPIKVYTAYISDLDFTKYTAMDIDDTGIYVSESDPNNSRLIYKKLGFGGEIIWPTIVNSPAPPEAGNPILTSSIRVDANRIVAVGYEAEYIDPDTFNRGRCDILSKEDGTLTTTHLWPSTVGYCTMTGTEIKNDDIFIGGYKTVPITDPGYTPVNTRWAMTMEWPTVE